ncbi:hypothetical protein L1987_83038 [Smallanthus sonchifolius]|uniref:Uncharacterized protein n=1 Tax=Smallanthus sonchifolius TaxID=185202 RepID=A0ACB8YC61_9ASTR|nr:hypothetical protein L1987_83038 [Smallanthus sonchifolius]
MLLHATTRPLLIDPEAGRYCCRRRPPPYATCRRGRPSKALNRWLRPEVYSLFAALDVGICGMQLVRNISGNPVLISFYDLLLYEPIRT